MEKEFVTYEQALDLKELGFDEDECLRVRDYEGYVNFTPAPLYQQAFRFFREKYGLCYVLEEWYENLFQFRIYDNNDKGFLTGSFLCLSGNDYDTYEQAEQACLDKLIEIARSVSDSDKTKESKQ